MTSPDQHSQWEIEYIRLQYALADALQEIERTSPPYDRSARDHYGTLRAASRIAWREMRRARERFDLPAAPPR